MTELPPTQQALVDAVQAEFDRSKILLSEKIKQLPSGMGDVIVAQNTLRTCMEAALIRMLPYDQTALAELAIRLASYAISAAPIDDQAGLVGAVCTTLPSAHARRVAQGVMICTTWETAK